MQAGPSGDDRGEYVRRQDDSNSHEEARTYQCMSRPPTTSEVLPVDPVTGSAQSSVAQQLCDQLLHSIHGCSRAEHKQKLSEHIESVGNNHNGLSEIFNNPAFPTVLGSPEMMTQDHLDRHQMPSAAQWNAMFCGASHPNRSFPFLVKNVCLHKERTDFVNPDVSYDI